METEDQSQARSFLACAHSEKYNAYIRKTTSVRDVKPLSDSFVLNHLILSGQSESVLCFLKECKLAKDNELLAAFTDTKQTVEYMSARVDACKAIMQGDIAQASNFIESTWPGLIANCAQLRYLLKLEQYIEMVVGGDAMEALAFAQANLSEFTSSSRQWKQTIHEALALLVFPDLNQCPFASTLLKKSDQRKRELADKVAVILVEETERLASEQLAGKEVKRRELSDHELEIKSRTLGKIASAVRFINVLQKEVPGNSIKITDFKTAELSGEPPTEQTPLE